MTVAATAATGRLHARRPRGRRPGPARRSGRSPSREGVEIPHLCYSPEPGYRADGNCRACMVEIAGRARPRPVVRPPPLARDEGRRPTRPAPGRPARWSWNCSLADQPPRDVAHDPDSKFWQWAERVGVTASRFPTRHAPAARPQPPGDGGPARRLHPVRPLRPRLPRGPGQRRHRHGLPRPLAPRSSSTSTTRWARARASPAASASRPARPAP